jgi:plastocyanin
MEEWAGTTATEVVVSGATETLYTIDIPAQNANSYEQLVWYIVERDVAVEVRDVTVKQAGASDPLYVISVSGTGGNILHYTLSGTDRNGAVSGNDPPVSLQVGDTVQFDLVNVHISHPFHIKTAATLGTGDEVSNPAATNNGAYGTTTITWTPTVAGTYYYICRYHIDMENTITVT